MIGMHFEKLHVWREAVELADCLYKQTGSFPVHERYGLVSQMRRAAISIASNIAEGSQRTSDKEFAHFILIARGSLAELYTQVVLAMRFGYLSVEHGGQMRDDMDRLSRRLHSFHQSSKLKAHSP